MNEEELNKLRLDDIEFFARRYSELFGEHFDKKTTQEKQEFYKEIKEELLGKVTKYEVVDSDVPGESYPDHIKLSRTSGAIENRAIRIHELFHSYNNMRNGKKGLKDFDNEAILKNLDEGSTEMFAQMICGNDSEDVGYVGEVKLTRFLTSIVSERTMIRSTRGNPQLLCETTDELLGTQGFLQKTEKLSGDKADLIRKSAGHDFWGDAVSSDVQILAQLKLETLKGKDEVSMLFDAVQQTGNYELFNRLVQTDGQYGYNVMFRRGLALDNNKFDSNGPTLASAQQQILRAEINELDEVEDVNLQTILEMEIKKFLYDKITFQESFLNHPEPEYGDLYELTPQDSEFAKNFRSDLDGASERIGGKMGVFGPGARPRILDATPFVIKEDIAKRVYLADAGFDELRDFRLQLWAEKLNIAQTREFLNECQTWVYNEYYKAMFPDGDEATFVDAIEAIKIGLDEKEHGLIEKYRTLESEKSQEKEIATMGTELQSQESDESIIPIKNSFKDKITNIFARIKKIFVRSEIMALDEKNMSNKGSDKTQDEFAQTIASLSTTDVEFANYVVGREPLSRDNEDVGLPTDQSNVI